MKKKLKKIDFSKITGPIFKGIDKIGKLSKLYRILISLGIILVFTGPIIYFLYLPKMEQVESLKKEVAELESKLTTLKAKVRKLARIRKQVKEAETEFKVVKKALPEEQEIPNLLASVSRSGQDAGLEFVLFQPNSEKKQSFFAEIPVSIRVTGNYHNVALFFDKVAKLPRIVNIDDINLSAQKGGKEGFSLQASCTAITYRFIEETKKKKKKKG